MDLVERTCTACGKVKFRVLPSSTRTTCSAECATDGMTWAERKAFNKSQFSAQPHKRGRKPLPPEEKAARIAAKREADRIRKREKYRNNADVRAREAERKRQAYQDPAWAEAERARQRERWHNLPEDVKKNETSAASSAAESTLPMNEPSGTPGTSETENERTPKSSSASAVEILPAASPPSSKALRQELLAHDGLLKASSTHLYGLMKGLVHNHPDPSCQRIDPDIAHATTGLASQLVKLSKLRLEGIKLAQELKKGKR